MEASDFDRFLLALLGHDTHRQALQLQKVIDNVYEAGFDSEEGLKRLTDEKLVKLGFREGDINLLRGGAGLFALRALLGRALARGMGRAEHPEADAVEKLVLQNCASISELAGLTDEELTKMGFRDGHISRLRNEQSALLSNTQTTNVIGLQVAENGHVEMRDLIQFLVTVEGGSFAQEQEAELIAFFKLLDGKLVEGLMNLRQMHDLRAGLLKLKLQCIRLPHLLKSVSHLIDKLEECVAMSVIELLKARYRGAVMGGFDGTETIDSKYVKVELRDWSKEDEEKAVRGDKSSVLDTLQKKSTVVDLSKLWEENKERRRVAVQGEAGAGKTTLLQRLAHEWASGTLWSDGFDAVVLIPLRKTRKAESMQEVLLQGLFDGDNTSAEDVALFLKWCGTHKSRVLWILDGWDELHNPCSALEAIRDNSKSNSCVEYLLGGSRPEGIKAYSQFGLVCDSVLALRGFSESGIAEFVNKWCEKRPDVKIGIEAALKSSRWLRDACKLPLMLQFVCMVAPKLQAGMRRKTELYQLVVEEMFDRFVARSKIVGDKQDEVRSSLRIVLRKLAFENFVAGQVMMSEVEWRTLSVLVRDSGFLREGSWVHYTMQEFFAAEFVCVDFEGDVAQELNRLRGEFGSKIDVFFGFVCGIGKKAKLCWESWYPRDFWKERATNNVLSNSGPISWLEEGENDLIVMLARYWRAEFNEFGGLMLRTACFLGCLCAVTCLLNWVEAKSFEHFTALHLACMEGHLKVTELLIENGADVGACGGDPNVTALHLACQNGHLDVALLLIEKGSKVQSRMRDNRTALHLACAGGYFKLSKMLIEKGSDLEARTNHNWTALHFACFYGHLQVAKLLVENKSDVRACTIDNFTALHMALKKGHLDVSRLLIEKTSDLQARYRLDNGTALHDLFYVVIPPIENLSDVGDGTALDLACEYGHLDIARLLIDNGSNVFDSSFHLACKNGHLEVALLLIEEGSKVQSRMRDNRTALHLACQNGHLDVALLLIEKGSKVQSRMRDNRTALHLACAGGYFKLSKMLIEKGSDLEARTNHNWTALHFACFYGHLQVAKLLVENKSDVRACTIDNFTALHMACQNGHLEVAELLIEEKTDLNARTVGGVTPLFVACLNGHLEVAELLIEQKADLNARTVDALTPLFAACHNGHAELVNLFIHLGVWNVEDNWALLRVVCVNGHLEVAKIIIASNRDIKGRCEEDWTELLGACSHCPKSVLRLLVENGAVSQKPISVSKHGCISFPSGILLCVCLSLLLKWFGEQYF